MSRRTFLSFNVIGAFVWVFGVTLAGYALADAIGDSIDKYLYPLIAAIIIISLIPPFLEWRKAKKQKPVHFTRPRPKPKPPPSTKSSKKTDPPAQQGCVT